MHSSSPDLNVNSSLTADVLSTAAESDGSGSHAIKGATPTSFGQTLQQAREKAGLSIETAAQQTKLHPRQIVALEQEDFSQLPEIAFIRGFIRSYARLLALDAEPLIQALNQFSQQNTANPISKNISPTIAELPQSSRNTRPLPEGAFKVGVILLAVLVLGALMAWIVTQQNPADRQTVASIIPEKTKISPERTQHGVGEASQNPTFSQTADSSITLTTQEAAWIEIIDNTQKILLAELVPADAVKQIGGAAPFSLTIGNAKAVRVTYQQKEVDLSPFIKQEVAHLTLP